MLNFAETWSIGATDHAPLFCFTGHRLTPAASIYIGLYSFFGESIYYCNTVRLILFG